jgi:hypothetical protein
MTTEFGTVIAAIMIYVLIAVNDSSFDSIHQNHLLTIIISEKGTENRYSLNPVHSLKYL